MASAVVQVEKNQQREKLRVQWGNPERVMYWKSNEELAPKGKYLLLQNEGNEGTETYSLDFRSRK